MNKLFSKRLRELAFSSFLRQPDNLPTDLTATNRQKDRQTEPPTLRLREVPVAPNKVQATKAVLTADSY